MEWEAFILAGGQARRLGGADKTALVVEGRSILDRQVETLAGRASRVTVVGGSGLRPLPAGVSVLGDALPGTGPLGALWTALAHASTPRVLVLAGDMPFVTAGFVEHLVAIGMAADVTLPRSAARLHPLCAAYRRDAAAVIRDALDQGVRRIGEALERLRLHVVEGRALEAFDPDGRLLLNINTPDDYARALVSRR